MATFTRSQRLLVSAVAGALGGAALLAALGGNISTLAGAGATAGNMTPSFAGADFPVCHTPAATGLPNMMLRLAQTEVPQAEMRPPAGGRFRRHRSAAVGGPRRRDLQDHDRERAGAVLFRSRAPAHLRVQSQRGAARLPQGAEARSRLRHVLLGRSSGARAQHQSADAGRRSGAGLRGSREGARSPPRRPRASRR